jgi:hypothetical protein
VGDPRNQREIGRDGVEAFLVKRVRLLGGQSIKLAPMQAGIPDRLVLLPGGRLFLVEVKAVGETPSEIQRHWHAKALKDQGVVVHVLVGEEGVRQWLRQVFAAPTVRPRSRRPAQRKTA